MTEMRIVKITESAGNARRLWVKMVERAGECPHGKGGEVREVSI